MNPHQYFVYIITNRSNNVLYTGVTNDLTKRLWEHKNKVYDGFSAKYFCNKLVYYEEYQYVQDAIEREKRLKGGNRKSKLDLVIKDNPEWKDLSDGWYDSM